MLSVFRNFNNFLSYFAPVQLLTKTHLFATTSILRETIPSEIEPIDEKKLKNDRSKVIPLEVGIKYLNSAAFKETYGDQLVWEQYRRNHKGLFAPKKTRKTCIRKSAISTGNPCPICRDKYLLLDYRNTELLKQFVSPHTGKVLSYTKTGLCQKKHLELMVAFERAMDYGLLEFDVPFRKYDYSEYYEEYLIKSKENF